MLIVEYGIRVHESEVGWFAYASIHPAQAYSFRICALVNQQGSNVVKVECFHGG